MKARKGIQLRRGRPALGRILHFSYGMVRNGRLLAVCRCTNEPVYLLQAKVTHDWAQVTCAKCLAQGQPVAEVAA